MGDALGEVRLPLRHWAGFLSTGMLATNLAMGLLIAGAALLSMALFASAELPPQVPSLDVVDCDWMDPSEFCRDHGPGGRTDSIPLEHLADFAAYRAWRMALGTAPVAWEPLHGWYDGAIALHLPHPEVFDPQYHRIGYGSSMYEEPLPFPTDWRSELERDVHNPPAPYTRAQLVALRADLTPWRASFLSNNLQKRRDRVSFQASQLSPEQARVMREGTEGTAVRWFAWGLSGIAMVVLPGGVLLGCAVWFTRRRTLVITATHLGWGESVWLFEAVRSIDVSDGVVTLELTTGERVCTPRGYTVRGGVALADTLARLLARAGASEDRSEALRGVRAVAERS